MFRVTTIVGPAADRPKIVLEIGLRRFGPPMGRT